MAMKTYLFAWRGLPLVKIGKTRGHPEHRMRDLAMPFQLDYCGHIDDDVEAELHAALVKHRFSLEWFNWTDDVKAEVSRRYGEEVAVIADASISAEAKGRPTNVQGASWHLLSGCTATHLACIMKHAVTRNLSSETRDLLSLPLLPGKHDMNRVQYAYKWVTAAMMRLTALGAIYSDPECGWAQHELTAQISKDFKWAIDNGSTPPSQRFYQNEYDASKAVLLGVVKEMGKLDPDFALSIDDWDKNVARLKVQRKYLMSRYLERQQPGKCEVTTVRCPAVGGLVTTA